MVVARMHIMRLVGNCCIAFSLESGTARSNEYSPQQRCGDGTTCAGAPVLSILRSCVRLLFGMDARCTAQGMTRMQYEIHCRMCCATAQNLFAMLVIDATLEW